MRNVCRVLFSRRWVISAPSCSSSCLEGKRKEERFPADEKCAYDKVFEGVVMYQKKSNLQNLIIITIDCIVLVLSLGIANYIRHQKFFRGLDRKSVV